MPNFDQAKGPVHRLTLTILRVGTPLEQLTELRAQFFLGKPGEPVPSGTIVDAFAVAIGRVATEDFHCVMDGGALTTRYEGIDGLREGWADFLGAFETIMIEPGETFEAADGLLEHVRLIGRPKGIDAEVQQDGAAVWRFRGDRVACVEFHLDRERARESAGLA